MRLSATRIDAAAIEAGIWFPKAGEVDFDGFPGVRLKVRGHTSTAFRARRLELMEALPKGAPQAARDTAFAQAIGEALLVDWSGFEDDADRPLAYDPALAAAEFASPNGRRLLSLVLMCAGLADEVQPSAEALVEKN